MINLEYKKLIDFAKSASSNSYSPYLGCAVGSAVLAASGKIYLGTNIENSSYGLSNCAERSALFNAFSNGESKINAIALWTPKSDVFPCGACCQVILELALNSDIIINSKNNILEILKYEIYYLTFLQKIV
ncbi:MAG: cytidine deaminase [Endomicrobium sp.]|jgi:cytidine deaminase|nr:cytidine deaminase [Endomicrobium sp.]